MSFVKIPGSALHINTKHITAVEEHEDLTYIHVRGYSGGNFRVHRPIHDVIKAIQQAEAETPVQANLKRMEEDIRAGKL